MRCAVLTSWPSSSTWVCDSRISASHLAPGLESPCGLNSSLFRAVFQNISLTSSTMSRTRLGSSEHVYNLVSLQLTIPNYWMVYMRKNFAFVFVAFSVQREPDVTNAFEHVQFSVQQICWTEREVRFRVRRFCCWTEPNRTFPTLFLLRVRGWFKWFHPATWFLLRRANISNSAIDSLSVRLRTIVISLKYWLILRSCRHGFYATHAAPRSMPTRQFSNQVVGQ